MYESLDLLGQMRQLCPGMLTATHLGCHECGKHLSRQVHPELQEGTMLDSATLRVFFWGGGIVTSYTGNMGRFSGQ